MINTRFFVHHTTFYDYDDYKNNIAYKRFTFSITIRYFLQILQQAFFVSLVRQITKNHHNTTTHLSRNCYSKTILTPLTRGINLTG